MRPVPQLQLSSVPQVPPKRGGFGFCPSPRKVTVRPDARRSVQEAPAPAASKSKIQVVKEELPPDYVPTSAEIEEYALWLGMDLQAEQHLLWIAQQALKAPCPEPWKPCLTEESEVFYFNFKTGESVWDHPVDVHSKKLYLDHHAKSQADAGKAVPSLCLALPHDQPQTVAEGVQACASPRKMTARAAIPREEMLMGVGAAAEADGAHATHQSMKVTVMEEELDASYEPTAAEIEEYAAWLGMDVAADSQLFWIARAGLKERCPEPWKPCRLEDNELFYFNFATGESIWDHPCDRIFQAMYQEHKGR